MQIPVIPSLFVTLFCATQSLAETPMTAAAEFEAYSTGKTLTYSVDGQVYGAEQYMPDRRVIWAFKGNACADGVWYEEAGLICFAYENDANPQCWIFYAGATGLRAEFTGDTAGSPVSKVDQSPLNTSLAHLVS